jgi:hypothetical protein
VVDADTVTTDPEEEHMEKTSTTAWTATASDF